MAKLSSIVVANAFTEDDSLVGVRDVGGVKTDLRFPKSQIASIATITPDKVLVNGATDDGVHAVVVGEGGISTTSVSAGILYLEDTNYETTENDHTIICDGNFSGSFNITMWLPDVTGKMLFIQSVNAASIDITPLSANIEPGSISYNIQANTGVCVQYEQTQNTWYIISTTNFNF